MQLYNPFQPISFKENSMLFNRKNIYRNGTQTIPVFPNGLSNVYQLEEALILIDNHKMKYKNIQLACKEVAEAIKQLDIDTQNSFLQQDMKL